MMKPTKSTIPPAGAMTSATPAEQKAATCNEAVISAVHDLNNSLSVIMTESELAVLVGSEKKRVQALRAIVTSAQEMRDTLARLKQVVGIAD